MGRVEPFDDPESTIHFLVALVLAILDPLALLSATVAFTGYQLVERERRARKLGDFIEWLSGILVGVILRCWLQSS